MRSTELVLKRLASMLHEIIGIVIELAAKRCFVLVKCGGSVLTNFCIHRSRFLGFYYEKYLEKWKKSFNPPPTSLLVPATASRGKKGARKALTLEVTRDFYPQFPVWDRAGNGIGMKVKQVTFGVS
ncbi:hypothetical protein M9H77_19920 [Catharanthus roseus]|uniref:Uncharacterized protein n=1 Tax=Catharanthus roseus TaxID=4058 RepID=A0ACC0AI11_CATRO|nr:hypothetical protein M9H77_19920 [Catharanthus roseus]